MAWSSGSQLCRPLKSPGCFDSSSALSYLYQSNRDPPWWELIPSIPSAPQVIPPAFLVLPLPSSLVYSVSESLPPLSTPIISGSSQLSSKSPLSLHTPTLILVNKNQGHWFSALAAYLESPGEFQKTQCLGPTLRVSDAIGLGVGPRH